MFSSTIHFQVCSSLLLCIPQKGRQGKSLGRRGFSGVSIKGHQTNLDSIAGCLILSLAQGPLRPSPGLRTVTFSRFKWLMIKRIEG